jgi:hypothetical protein
MGSVALILFRLFFIKFLELIKVENQFTLDAMQIEAAKEIGVAYGKNQPEHIVYYNINGWW